MTAAKKTHTARHQRAKAIANSTNCFLTKIMTTAYIVSRLKQILCDETPRCPIICADVWPQSFVTLSVLRPPAPSSTPSSSHAEIASKCNKMFPSIHQHVHNLRPHFCLCHRTTALAHGIAAQVISWQVLRYR